MKVTYKEFKTQVQRIVNYFASWADAYSTCAHDVQACLVAIKNCREKEKAKPKNTSAYREMLAGTFAQYEFETDPLTPLDNLDTLQEDFTIKFNLASQSHMDNLAAANALKKLPRLAFMFSTIQKSGIPCSDTNLDPTTFLSNILLPRMERLIKNDQNPPNEPMQKFLVRSVDTQDLSQTICKFISDLEQWILPNLFDLIRHNKTLTNTIDANPEIHERLERIEMHQIESNAIINKMKGNLSLMSVDLTNEIKDAQNFRYNTNNHLKNIENETAFVAANMPPSEQIVPAIDAAKHKAQKIVSDDNALFIMKAICKEYATATSRQTLINWRKAGHEPTTGKIITDSAFSSLQAWTIWCQEFYTEMEKRAQIKESIQKRTKTNPPRPKKQQ